MNSRERVKKVLNGEMPDRVPNGLGGCETAGVHAVAYEQLQKALGLEVMPPRVDTFMFNAVFETPVIRAMEGDIILLDSPNMCKSPLRFPKEGQWRKQKLWGKTFEVSEHEVFTQREDGSIVWENNRGAICPKGTYYFDRPQPTDMTAELFVPDPDSLVISDTIDEDKLIRLEKAAERIYNETDLAICLGESIRDLQAHPGGTVNTMLLMLEEPEVMHAILERCTNAALKQIKLLEQAVGKYVDILAIAHDFGDNRGVTIGAPLWREIYKPYYNKLFSGWHGITDMKINLHSCGSISEIMDDLIECGVDIINPVQTSAADMGAKSLKDRFGDRVIFYGGAYDAQLIDKNADYDTVYRAVYDNVKILGKGGRYFFAGVHNLPSDIPEHHFKAMINAYRDARNY